jgi:hypothetical protein
VPSLHTARAGAPVRRLASAMTLVVLLCMAGAGSAEAASRTSRGYDISWPQCGGSYPSSPAFGIVGVNKGIVFSANPCLASEITWAGGTRAQLYANTGNPGPGLSSHWPTGQASPRFCDPSAPDSLDCAYDYGWNAAADSYADAVTAWSALRLPGSPAASPWWLDVETGNSWRTDTAKNVAALQGAADSLTAAGVAALGFYSTQLQWNEITGGTLAFSARPSWVAGARSLKGAQDRCHGSGFTGGPVTLAQYPASGFDADLAC